MSSVEYQSAPFTLRLGSIADSRNLIEEITDQLSYIREWGGQFAVPIPAVQIF